MTRARVLPLQGLRPQSDSFAKTQLAEAVDSQRRDANRLPFATGVWLRDVAVPAAGVVKVSHNLGHVPSGYIVTKSLAGPGVFLASQGALTANEVTFTNSGAVAVTIDVWIF